MGRLLGDKVTWVYDNDDTIITGFYNCLNCDEPSYYQEESIFCESCHNAFKLVPDKSEIKRLLKDKIKEPHGLDPGYLQSYTEYDNEVIFSTNEYKFTVDLNNYKLKVNFLTEFQICTK